MVHMLCALLAASAAEQGAYVLRIEGRNTYFDLGRAAGAAPGAKVRVLRLVSGTNPVTQAIVRDRFVIGEIEIAEAGEVLSRAQPDGALARLIKVGDKIELSRPPPPPDTAAPSGLRPSPAEPAPPAAVSCAPPPPVDPEASAFLEAFFKAQDLPVQERIAYWQKFAAEHGAWAVSKSVKREIEALRPAPAPAAVAVAKPPPPEEPEKPQISAPKRALAGDPFEVVLDFLDGKPAKAAVLNWRPRGATLFRTVAFEPPGSGEAKYWRARLPADAVATPGIDYSVSLIDQKGIEQPLGEPTPVEVAPVPGTDTVERKQRSRASLWFDYANWNSKSANDYHYNLEGEFLYRTLKGLHSVRMGFGIYQGKGESLEDEKLGRPPQDVGYHYGFTEFELQPFEMIGLRLKLLTGVDRAGFNTGIEGRLRIGEDNGTNLVLASGFTGGIGNRNEITLTWDRVKGWPMSGSVVVTNEPVETDYGVRFIYSLGRSFGSYLDLSLRLSYELRNIEHGGFGVGIADSFHW